METEAKGRNECGTVAHQTLVAVEMGIQVPVVDPVGHRELWGKRDYVTGWGLI